MAHDTHPSPAPIDYRAVIADGSGRFAELLDGNQLDAPVAGCPGWTLQDLGHHLGDVQRWAASILQTGEQEPKDFEPGDASLADWFREGTQMLLAAIDASKPTDPCWNLWPHAEQTKRFWFRRQALELAVHRWDAEAAVSTDPAPIVATVAADVVDEFVHIMLSRMLERAEVDFASLDGDVHFHCTDTAGEWTFEAIDGQLVVTDEHRKSAVAARGSAHDLALLAWGRGDRAGVEIFGDGDLLDRWLLQAGV